MRKHLFIILIVVFSIYMFGCGKKEEGIEESQESMSMEALSVPAMNAPTTSPAKAPEVTQTAPLSQAQLGPLPPAGPYKPTKQEIQTALKNAGFYSGEIDGKIGPMSKKAIEDFQKANNLKADGKVGPATWDALSKYLNPEPAPTVSTTIPVKKKR